MIDPAYSMLNSTETSLSAHRRAEIRGLADVSLLTPKSLQTLHTRKFVLYVSPELKVLISLRIIVWLMHFIKHTGRKIHLVEVKKPLPNTGIYSCANVGLSKPLYLRQSVLVCCPKFTFFCSTISLAFLVHSMLCSLGTRAAKRQLGHSSKSFCIDST